MSVELIFTVVPFVIKAVDRYFSNEVPKTVTDQIEKSVAEIVRSSVTSFVERVHRTKNSYLFLGGLSLILTCVNMALKSPALEGVIFIFLYLIPVFMTARSFMDLIKALNYASGIEGVISNKLKIEIDSLHLSKKTLYGIYEKRSIEELSKYAAGAIFFETLKNIKLNKKELFLAFAGYSLSMINLIFYTILFLMKKPALKRA